MMLQPTAVIHIKDLKVRAVIGTLEHERVSPQDLVANIHLEYDASLAAQTDALGHAVDYAAIHDKLLERVATTRFLLLERLAAFMLELIMEDRRIISARVTLEKPAALSGAGAVIVSMSAGDGDRKSPGSLRCC